MSTPQLITPSIMGPAQPADAGGSAPYTPRSSPKGTLSWPTLYVNRDRVQDPALEMMGPAPEGVDSMIGSQLIELIDPLEKSTDCARVNVQVVIGDPANQAIRIASKSQERCPQRCIFGVEGCFRDALGPARHGSPDRLPSRLDDRWRLAL
jgi:hypothetical protein